MFWLGKSISPDVESELVGEEGEGKKGKEKGKPVVKNKEDLSLSPIEVLILAHLRSRELRNDDEESRHYGYEMIQQLNDLFAGSWEAKSGTIYPILSKLEGNKKMIRGERMQSPLGPVKKVYCLEEIGRRTIDSIILQHFKGDLDFMLHYLELLTPFITKIEDPQKKDAIFQELTEISSTIAQLPKEQAVTEFDQQIRKRKLEVFIKNLEEILQKLKKELVQIDSPN